MRTNHGRHPQTGAGLGQLPAKAPLANPYVPFQFEDPPMYNPQKAFVRGTLYCGLDLPFMGMVNQEKKKLTPKSELQTIAFVLQELTLYLDTHPDDTQALELYRNYQKAYHNAMMQYTENCAPLNHITPDGSKSYSWLKDPWPWEYAANKEG